jgi:XRE family aerobic/anaerobic benzoate catabolism transcriptional regulator
MAASKEALQDLKNILDGRQSFYSKAQFAIHTSAQDLDATFELLRATVRGYLQITP